MKDGNLRKNDTANGEGIRVTIFVSGCSHHCSQCFQPETWDPKFGKPYTSKVEKEIIEALKPAYVSGLTLLGGEPFEPYNQRELLPLLRRIRKEMPDKTIWSYTGYLYDDELLKDSRARCEATDEMLSLVDVLVDGEFRIDQKNLSLRYRGSSNQRIIDVKKSLNEIKVVLRNDLMA